MEDEQLEGELLWCPVCSATWRLEAVVEALPGPLRCLLCGGSLTPVP